MGSMEDLRKQVPAHVLTVVDHIWSQPDLFVHWLQRAQCFWAGCVRIQYHQYGDEHREQLRAAGIRIDGWSDGAGHSGILAQRPRPPVTARAGQAAERASHLRKVSKSRPVAQLMP